MSEPTRYFVTVQRTETIVFEVEATDEQEAQAHYLADGDEVGSETSSLTVLSVTEVDA